MTLNEPDLKALYQRATARRAGGTSCPDAETLARAAAGDFERDGRLAIADHLAGCSDCVAEYRMLAPDRVESAGEIRPFRPRPAAWRVVALAASLVLAAGITAAVWLGGASGPPPAPIERGPRPSVSRVEPADGALLPSPPARLAWNAPGAGHRYRVLIFDAESTPVWESAEVRETSLPLPAEVRARLRGGPFYWRVVTLGGGGPRESQTFQFVVAP